MKTDFKRLDELAEQGYLRRVISPCGRLVLYNYSDKCTFEKKWNEYTLNARGTVYELSSGAVVAQAFPKFFNFEELPKSKSRNLAKQTEFSVTEKVDGSLGIVYYYDSRWHINTRGSFTSDQAIYAKEKLMPKYDYSLIRKNVTMLVEIIYPGNKIIVDYGIEEKLVMLASFNSETGEEIPREDMPLASATSRMPLINEHRFNTIEDLIEHQQSLPAQEEGFVVRFDKRNERVKFKSPEYLKLARLLSHMTPLHFWEHMVKGRVDEALLERFPEEFREEVDFIANTLQEMYLSIKVSILEDVVPLIKETENEEDQRKAIGLRLKDYKHGSCAFTYLDGDKDKIDSYIMKRLRPKGNEMPKV